MGEQYLYQKCPFLKALSQEKREQFEIYFRTAPDWLIDSLVVEKIKKGTTFIRENNPADTILCSFKKCMHLVEWNLSWIWMCTKLHFEL